MLAGTQDCTAGGSIGSFLGSSNNVVATGPRDKEELAVPVADTSRHRQSTQR